MKEGLQKKIKSLGLKCYLEKKGIDEEAILESKNNSASTCQEKYCYYDLKENERIEDTFVPLSKVKGVDRVEGYSWYDMLNYGVTDIPEDIRDDFNLSTDRFLNILEWLEEEDLEEVKYRYSNTKNVHFTCFKNGHKEEYYQVMDGNHRVIIGKVLGIEKIRASSVSIYEYNEEKHREYEREQKRGQERERILKEKEEEIKRLVKELGLECDKKTIRLKMDDDSKIVYSFTNKERDIDERERQVDYGLNRLKRIKETVSTWHTVYRCVPECLKRRVLKIVSRSSSEKAISHMIALLKD